MQQTYPNPAPPLMLLLSGEIPQWNDWRKINPGPVDLSGANLQGIYCREADLSNANLSRANLRKAGFHQCDFYGSDLSLTNLTGVDFLRCRLELCKGLLSFSSEGQHLAFANWSDYYRRELSRDGIEPGDGVYVKIGCMGFGLREWIRCYEQAGADHLYTRKQIEDYGDWLRHVRQVAPDEFQLKEAELDPIAL